MNKPSTNASFLFCVTQMEPLPSTSTATDYKSEPLLLEMFNCAATDLNEKGVINIKKYKNISISHLTNMESHQLIGLAGPANNFAMGGLPMNLTKVLLMEGKSLPKELFMEIIIEKAHILVEHVKNHQLGLCLTANINGNNAVIRLYDNYATVNTQLLQVTLSNLPNLENQLFGLYVEVTGMLHNLMPEDYDDIPELEDITDGEDI